MRDVSAEVVERALIRETIEEYFNSLDRLDRPALLACFAEGVTATYHSGTPKARATVGAEACVAALMRTRATHESQNFTIGSVSIRLNGLQADAVTFAIIQHLTNGRVTIAGMRYDDHFAKQGHRWVIARRDHRRLWEYGAAANPGM